jgi:hypothetical protein
MVPDARNREVLGNRVDHLQADDARSTAARPVAHEANPGAKSIEAPARGPRIAVHEYMKEADKFIAEAIKVSAPK